MELVIKENAVQLAAIKEAITELFAPYQSKEFGAELTALKSEVNRYMDDESRDYEPLPFGNNVPKFPLVMHEDGYRVHEEFESATGIRYRKTGTGYKKNLKGAGK